MTCAPGPDGEPGPAQRPHGSGEEGIAEMASQRQRRSAGGRAPAARQQGSADLVRALSPAERSQLEAVLREIQRASRGQDCGQEDGKAVQLWRPRELAMPAYARHHRAPLLAAASVGGADLAVLAAHAAGGPAAYGAIAAAAVAAGGRVAWQHRPKARRRPRARRWAAGAWTAGTATALAGTAAGMASGPGQGVMLLGGLALAAPYLWHQRRRPQQQEQLPEDGTPAELPAADPRIEAFQARFCQSGPCKDAELHSLRDITDGFAFEVLLQQPEATTRDVISLIPRIAALYDVSADQVSVEYVPGRSERRALISVLTVRDAWEREDHWDGRPTYDPCTGQIRIGRFADGTDCHWLLHRPGSGAAGGVISGMIGTGKTGTTHVIAAEAGQAMQCTVCGPAGTCGRCDRRRVIALWLGDPQMQPLGVWHGFADLMAWGPAACAHLIVMAYTAMRERAARRGAATWTDHLGRVNTGRGSFDPTADEPVLYVIIDEWPLIVADKTLWAIIAPLAAAIVKEGRKVGVVLVLLTQMPDLTQLGLRELRELLKAFNVLSHRTDGLSKHMLGIQGDTSALAPGVHGLGYINGVDGRPGAVMRTKHLPEYLEPGETGIDVRDLAERISRLPLRLDDPVLTVISPLGYTTRGQVLDGEAFTTALEHTEQASRAGRPLTIEDALRRAVAGDTRQRPAASSPAPAAPAAPVPAAPAAPASPLPSPPPAAGEAGGMPLPLLATMLADRGEMDLWDVSAAADVDALTADQALRSLEAAGAAVQVAPGRYRTTITQPVPSPPGPDPLDRS